MSSEPGLIRFVESQLDDLRDAIALAGQDLVYDREDQADRHRREREKAKSERPFAIGHRMADIYGVRRADFVHS